jgi:RNA recognition motif-containing protein
MDKRKRLINEFAESSDSPTEISAKSHISKSTLNPNNSTNLYISDISKAATEQDVMKAFGKFGPIAGCKILWPRSNDVVRQLNSGFVSFMLQTDAEKAFDDMEGKMFFGHRLTVKWAKPVSLPSTPIYSESANEFQADREHVPKDSNKEYIEVVVPDSEEELKTINTSNLV